MEENNGQKWKKIQDSVVWRVLSATSVPRRIKSKEEEEEKATYAAKIFEKHLKLSNYECRLCPA